MVTKNLLILVIVIFLAAAGYYYFAPQANGPAMEDDPVLRSLGEEGWQTYRNEEYGFEMKYPTYYSTVLQEDPRGTQFIVRFINPTQKPKLDTDQPRDNVLVFDLMTKETKTPGYWCEGKETDIDGHLAKITDWELGFGLVEYKIICYPEKNLIFWLSALTEESRILLDQILSTLKFTK